MVEEKKPKLPDSIFKYLILRFLITLYDACQLFDITIIIIPNSYLQNINFPNFFKNCNFY